AALLTQTLGRDITRRAVGPDEARANMITSGMVAEVADAMIELAGLAPKGYLSGTETTVQDVLGRPARRFAGFITENAAAFGR
ncbi:MAG: SDR family NAD(P)-dependent oxidoreductase, partial [Sulfitobacter sp.]|nr:SDR family NAD(P)-dependent oxidoreductase [Sulfitobacter sp.]